MSGQSNNIPITVGVTGHRMIAAQDHAVLFEAVKRELQKIAALCPNSPIVMLNSLCEGGDLLCADAAEELGIELAAALPMPLEEYEKSFSEAGRARLAHHCARAKEVFCVPSVEAKPANAGRNFLYRQAGIYVAAHSHVLLALWDGGPGTSAACGAAETVDFALSGSYDPDFGIAVRSGANEEVIHILAAREGAQKTFGEVRYLGETEIVRKILHDTDEFNRLVKAEGEIPARAGSPEAQEDKTLLRMQRIGAAAGRMSGKNAQKYRRLLALLAAACAAVTFAFLMYDEAQAIWMILVCGGMLIAAAFCVRLANRLDCHRRYLEFRALAECLRVQSFLRYAGSNLEAASLLTWTQQEETAWILAALCALSVGAPPAEPHDIREPWVRAQRDYHKAAGIRSGGELQKSERVVRIALILSITLYLAAVVFEFFCGGLIFRPLYEIGDVETYRTILKILLGTISAVTLFIANYYGRLSLPRVQSDHEKMERFYSRMEVLLTRHGQTRELLEVLAREELIENGNWSSYERDNKPDISI